jgi:hypothetical protein
MRPSDRATPTPALDCATAEHIIDSVAGDFNLDPDNPTSSFSKLEANQWGATLAATFTNTDPGEDSVWFAIPNSNSPSIIKQATAATAGAGEHQTLTLGAKVDYSLPPTSVNDGYQNTIVVTATANTVSLPKPTITGIDPNKGGIAGGTSIAIAGTNLDTAYQVFIDLNNDGSQNTGEACTSPNIVSATQITCVTPTAAAGTYDVVVKTWGGETKTGSGTTATLADNFTYEIPYQPPTAYTPTSQWVKAAADTSAAISSITGTDGGSFINGQPGYIVDMDANMIPVVNRASNGAYPASWCNYDSKQWCNAVTLNNTTAKYTTTGATGGTLTAFTYFRDYATAGKVIPEADILGYWTYIPRYAYQVQRYAYTDTAITTPTLFQIVFQKAGTSTCTAANKPNTGSTTKCSPKAKNQWATHPAFTFGTKELNGIWVGKFETSSPDITDSVDAANTQVTANKVFIKPNQYSLNAQNVSTQFKVARAMGIVSDDEQINLKMNGSSGILNSVTGLTIPQNTQNLTSATNTRMLKNSDWGAIVYLSASAYGAGVITNSSAGAVQVNANSTSLGITGCGPSANNSIATYDGGTNCGGDKSYYSTNGKLASTTNNVYGIYDMSGGSWEYTLANYNQSAGYYCPNHLSYWSGFTGACYNGTPNPVTTALTPSAIAWGSIGFDAKYYNLYTFTDISSCSFTTCGGHASYETAGWNGDYANFAASDAPWFSRGGDASNGTNTGLFAFAIGNGWQTTYFGFHALQSAF